MSADSLADSHKDAVLTLREVLQTPSFEGTEVLAGRTGLDRVVASVNIMENPDITPWVKQSELLLTVGYSLKGSGTDVARLVASLDDLGLAGFGVKLGPYVTEIEARALAVADRLGFPILALPPAVSFDDLITDIHGARDSLLLGGLARRRDREQELMTIALGGAGPADLTAELARLIDSEVLILGPGNEIIAQCDGSGSPQLRDTTETTQFADALSAPIVFGSTYVGHLYVLPGAGARSPFFPGLVPTCAKIMALAASREMAVASVDGQFRAEFLERLLLDRLDRREVDQRCQALEWKVEFPAVVLSLSPASLDTTPHLERTEDALDWSLRARGLHAPHAIINGAIVAIVGRSEGDDSADATAAATAEELITRSTVGYWQAGISETVEGPADLKKGWNQAEEAIRVVRKVDGIGPIGVFGDLGIYRLLSEIDPGHRWDYAQGVLGDLLSDKGGMVELRHTLTVLLSENMNVAQTARTMHFHYNSIRYRITQLEKILGPFASDPTSRLELQIALLIAETMAEGADVGTQTPARIP